MKTLKFLGIAGIMLALAACGGNKQQAADEAAANEDAFYASQPIESGIYDASFFDIQGKDARKGQFDGRVIASISPDQSAVFVYENGNRTKIKHLMMLEAPFEKNDSIYTATSKGNPVTLAIDSADYILTYVANNDTVAITFDRKARSSYSPIEALEKIQQETAR